MIHTIQHGPNAEYRVLIAWGTHRGPLPAFTHSLSLLTANIVNKPQLQTSRRWAENTKGAEQPERRAGKPDRRAQLAGKLRAGVTERRRAGGRIHGFKSTYHQSLYAHILCETTSDETLKGGYTHLMVLDDDHDFPVDALHRMLSWKQPIVATNYCMRTEPPYPVMREPAEDNDPPHIKYSGRPMFIDWQDQVGNSTHGLRPFFRAGVGCCLIEADVFRSIGPKPWFAMPWEGDDMPGMTYMGNDYYFFKLCEERGIPLQCDTGLSMRIGHNGYKRYALDQIKEEFRAPWKLQYNTDQMLPFDVAGNLIKAWDPKTKSAEELSLDVYRVFQTADAVSKQEAERAQQSPASPPPGQRV